MNINWKSYNFKDIFKCYIITLKQKCKLYLSKSFFISVYKYSDRQCISNLSNMQTKNCLVLNLDLGQC